MNALAQPVISADTHPPLLLRSPRVELQRGWQIYADKRPIDDCATLMERRGWESANKAEAMTTMPVVMQ